MIVSVSRRTDIPAFYADWFFRRLEEGYALVRHPWNPRRVSRVSLTPDAVDGFVFWTKNPLPMLGRLSRLEPYAYYVHFTLNAYGRDVETGVPSKRDVLIPAFRTLAERAGRERVIWRYDPIFLSARYTVEYHLRYFEKLATLLAPCAETCVISFLDRYRNTERNMAPLGLSPFPPSLQASLAGRLAEIARACGLRMEACAEEADLSSLGVGRARCVDAERLGRLRKRPLSVPKDRRQRAACGCAESVDIGAYGSCSHGCRYCYASARRVALPGGEERDVASPLLVGHLEKDDVVTERVSASREDRQGVLPGCGVSS